MPNSLSAIKGFTHRKLGCWLPNSQDIEVDRKAHTGTTVSWKGVALDAGGRMTLRTGA